jgi:hypothetical protein
MAGNGLDAGFGPDGALQPIGNADPYGPEHLRGVGGLFAPVHPVGLVVMDVYPQRLRITEPSRHGVAKWLRQLRSQTPSGRVKVLLHLTHWPKLLEAVLVEEKRLFVLEHKRLKTRDARADQKRARVQREASEPAASAAAAACGAAAASEPAASAAAAAGPCASASAASASASAAPASASAAPVSPDVSHADLFDSDSDDDLSSDLELEVMHAAAVEHTG